MSWVAGFEQRVIRWAPWISTALCLAVLALAATAVYLLLHYQPKTACQTDPASRACQEIRADAAHAQSKRVACIPFHQVGYLCPAPQLVKGEKGVPQPRSSSSGSGSGGTTTPEGGNDATSTAPTPTGTEPGGGGGDPGGGDSGGGPPTDGGGSTPSPTPGPPGPPGPQGPPGQPPAADDGSVLGTGLDLPGIDECGTIVVKGICQ